MAALLVGMVVSGYGFFRHVAPISNTDTANVRTTTDSVRSRIGCLPYTRPLARIVARTSREFLFDLILWWRATFVVVALIVSL